MPKTPEQQLQDILSYRDPLRFLLKLDFGVGAVIAALVAFFKIPGDVVLSVTHDKIDVVFFAGPFVVFGIFLEVCIQLSVQWSWFRGQLHGALPVMYGVWGFLHIGAVPLVLYWILGFMAGYFAATSSPV